jgi:hypothetical protein
MSKLFSLKSIYFQYCTIAIIYFTLALVNFFTQTGEQVGFLVTMLVTISFFYYLFLIYKLFKKLINLGKASDFKNKYLENKWLPLLCAFPITGIIFDPITIFQLGKHQTSKLSNSKMFNQLSIFNLVWSIFSLSYLLFSLLILKQSNTEIGVYGIINNIILTFLPMYLIGVLVFTVEKKSYIK